MPEGYQFKTTFFMDYRIANAFGAEAVTDTYHRSFDAWKDNVVYMKEMAFVLNMMCWEFYRKGNEPMSKLYADLYYKCRDKCLRHFKGEELREFWEFLD